MSASDIERALNYECRKSRKLAQLSKYYNTSPTTLETILSLPSSHLKVKWKTAKGAYPWTNFRWLPIMRTIGKMTTIFKRYMPFYRQPKSVCDKNGEVAPFEFLLATIID